MRRTLNFAEAIASYNRETDREYIALGEKERQEISGRFPRNGWPSMPIEKYALGQGPGDGTFCTWIEFRARHLGSISGGSSKKLLIYKRKNDDGWFFDPTYGSVEHAWEEVRGGFVRAFELAEAGEWAAIDEVKPIFTGSALKVKTLHLYFPQHVMPVAARPHLLHFMQALGALTPELASAERITLNRALTNTVQSLPEFTGWTTNEIERFLYWWTHPNETGRIVKIAPGENAKYWSDCLDHGYIRVGWDEVGDLRQFAGKDEFEEEFRKKYSHIYNNHAPTLKKKGNELWQLAEFEEGDIVIANKGISRILAVGEVVSPAYEWNEALAEFRHTVRVKWDASYAQDIEPQKRWALVTVANVPSELYETILTKSGKIDPSGIAHPRTFASEKIADSCFAVRRPLSDPLRSTESERCSPLIFPVPLPLACPFPLLLAAGGTSKYKWSPTPNRVAHFLRQSVAAAFRSSPSEMIELSFLAFVILDFPN
jgi:5-methylcytosine-specific restriction protein B